MTDDVRRDAFLGSRLHLWQPVRGYRSGADAVLLAAACPARPGQMVLELGCGAGVAALCLAARVPGLTLHGVEMQPDLAALARTNAAQNGHALCVETADLTCLPQDLRQIGFDHVILNPPYFTAGSAAPDAGRAASRHEATPLADWLGTGLRRLRNGGTMTVIQRADRLAEMLGLLGGAGVRVRPVASRAGRAAGRVIVQVVKGRRAPFTLLAPLILHAADRHLRDAEDLTPQAQDILRRAAPLDWA